MAANEEPEKPKSWEPDLGELGEFLDVPYEITIEVGRTMMTIDELLRLGRGAIIELTKSAGESYEVLANGRLIAHGEVTIIDDCFALRITDFVDSAGRQGD